MPSLRPWTPSGVGSQVRRCRKLQSRKFVPVLLQSFNIEAHRAAIELARPIVCRNEQSPPSRFGPARRKKGRADFASDEETS
jgi:hypothetical protein